jgi:hypothetical protein
VQELFLLRLPEVQPKWSLHSVRLDTEYQRRHRQMRTGVGLFLERVAGGHALQLHLPDVQRQQVQLHLVLLGLLPQRQRLPGLQFQLRHLHWRQHQLHLMLLGVLHQRQRVPALRVRLQHLQQHYQLRHLQKRLHA